MVRWFGRALAWLVLSAAVTLLLLGVAAGDLTVLVVTSRETRPGPGPPPAPCVVFASASS
jgi:hypothetical protein